MKILIPIGLTLCLIGKGHAQTIDSLKPKWEVSAHLNMYFFPDDFIMLPILTADKGTLHLEARYNYEDLNTFSGWAGYNFKGGNNFEYMFTPMLGGVVGNSNGLAPGLEMTLSFKKFELYSEGEYLFDLGAKENDFFYNWSDLTYSIKDWLWFGISTQRTRLYHTDLDLQRGLILGGGYKNFELTTYFYNIGDVSRFGLLSITYNF